jgi:hypothetical protein
MGQFYSFELDRRGQPIVPAREQPYEAKRTVDSGWRAKGNLATTRTDGVTSRNGGAPNNNNGGNIANGPRHNEGNNEFVMSLPPGGYEIETSDILDPTSMLKEQEEGERRLGDL